MSEKLTKAERKAILIKALKQENWKVENVSRFIRKYGGNFEVSDRTVRRELHSILASMDNFIDHSKAVAEQKKG